MVMTVSYVGSEGHNMLVVQPTNPGDPALCLSVSQRESGRAGQRDVRTVRRERRLHDERTAR